MTKRLMSAPGLRAWLATLCAATVAPAQLQTRGGGAAGGGAVAGAPTCGDPACEYSLDDGLDDDDVGLTGGGDIFCANPFTATQGCQVITCVRIVWGDLPATGPMAPARVFLYEDPTDDGDPSDAILLTSELSVATGNEAPAPNGVFTEYAITPTVVTGVFFAGFAIAHANAEFPAAIDETVSQGMSWTAVGFADPDDPLDAPPTLGLIDDFGIPGNWMIRAVGGSVETGADCLGDTDQNHTVNVDDLTNVIVGWGTDGMLGISPLTGRPIFADQFGQNPGDPPDGTVDVNDLTGLIGAWGDCPVLNDECADAAVIGSGVTEFHTVGATLDGPTVGNGCAQGMHETDVWFRYAAPVWPPGGGTLRLDTCGSDFDTIITVYDGWNCPADPAVELGCSDDEGCPGQFQSELAVPAIAAGQQVTIRVSGWEGDSEGWGMLDVFLDSEGGFPVNDQCVESIGDPLYELIADGPPFVGTTLLSLPDADAFPCGFPVQAPGAWFWFDGDGNEKTITVDCTMTDYDAQLHVYCWSGDCSTMLCIGGDNDGCGGDMVPPVFSFVTEPGQRYAVYVDGWDGAQGSFEISMTTGGPGSPVFCEGPPQNDDCASYLQITDGIHPYSTNQVQIQPDGPDNAGFACNDGGSTQTWSDIWFCYQADTGGEPDGLLTVSTCPDVIAGGLGPVAAADYDTDLVVYGPFGTPGDILAACDAMNLNDFHLACNDDDAVNNCGLDPLFASTIQTLALDGSYYLIRVGGWGEGDFGTGELLVACTPAEIQICDFATNVDRDSGDDDGVPAPGAGDGENGPITGGDTVQVGTAGFDPDSHPALAACGGAITSPSVWVRAVGNGNTYAYQACAVPMFSFDSRVKLVCGPCFDIECVEENTNNAACDPNTEAGTWCTKAGAEYFLVISGEGAATGVVDVTVADLGTACTDPPCQPCVTPTGSGLDSECVADAYEAIAQANNPTPEDCRGAGDPDQNGGCNMATGTEQFGVRLTGQALPYSICGTTSTLVFAGSAVRDTDWHVWSPAVDGNYTWDVDAEFLAHGLIANWPPLVPGQSLDCTQTFTAITGQFGNGECLGNALTFDFLAGDTYLLFASLQSADNGGADIPCSDDSGGAYIATLSGPN